MEIFKSKLWMKMFFSEDKVSSQIVEIHPHAEGLLSVRWDANYPKSFEDIDREQTSCTKINFCLKEIFPQK